MRTAKDFPVDSEIRHLGNKTRRGTVIGNNLKDGDQVVAVEWADGSLAKVNVNDIEICLSVEEEFELVKDQVNEKLQRAAELIHEANKLAREGGRSGLVEESYDSTFEVHLLENAMEQAGWNTSSWYC